MFEKLHDRLIQLAGLYQLMSVNEKLSCNREVKFESVIKSLSKVYFAHLKSENKASMA